MAIQIVMDRTGDSRHHFNSHDAQELAKAEQRFYELTKVGFTAAVRTGPGQVSPDPIVRPERGGDRFLPQAGRRVVGLSAMFGFRPLPPGGRSRKRATRALFIRHGSEGTPEGRSLAAIAKMAVAEPARAVRQKGLL